MRKKSKSKNDPAKTFDILASIDTSAPSVSTSAAYVERPFTGTGDESLIRSGLHAQLQKFGRKPKPYQGNLFDRLTSEDTKSLTTLNPDQQKLRENIDIFKIEVAGIDLTLAQQKALDVIQKILTDTRYRGNYESREVTDARNEMKYKGTIPRLSFTPSQYLDFYGVEKHETGRGFLEYSGKAREEALQALRDLNDRKYFIYYERGYKDEHGKDRVDVITAVRPLIQILEGYEGLTRSEAGQVKAGDPSAPKVTHLIVEPCTILIDQIDSRFILKPAKTHQEAKILLGKYSKYLILLIEHLCTHATLNRGEITFTEDVETLSYTLRIDYLIKTHQYKRLKRDILKYFEQAKKMGYVNSYEMKNTGTGDKITYTLNRGKINGKI